MDDDSSFGYWVRRRRKALDLTQEDLAKQISCALDTIRKIESGARRPSRQIAERLANQLEVPAETRAAFLQAARAELVVDRLPLPTTIPSSVRPGHSQHTAPLVGLPTGTITFFCTDIAGSTQLWEQHPEAMRLALARHDTLLRQTIAAHDGIVFKSGGDGLHAAFTRAPQALAAAVAAQQALLTEPWSETGPLHVRMVLHTGVTEERDGDYFGPPLNRVARLLAAGHGGQILLSLATAELVRDYMPTDTSLRDLGVHRLKDLSRPEQIFQLLAPNLSVDFPPLNTLDARRTNLPAQPTALIGREREIAGVCALLRRTDVRLLTLTGPGGTGKTRLALQVGAEVLDDFADGVYFVDLAPIRDPALIASTIMQALGIVETGDQPTQARLQSYLRNKQLLLLLDNFEQVVDAAPLVAELLAACTQLKVLVTSRMPLHLRGEQEVAVPPLALPDLHQLPELAALSQYAAVALFIQRARAVQPDFAVTNATAPAVAEICHRLDGLPLAIELTATRVKLLPLPALLARLDNRLKLLTGGARDQPARQQTIRATIAWSNDLLEADTQPLFRRLAVFVGGCTLEAVAAVCNASGDLPLDVLDGLATLVDTSLLRREEGADGESRFMMLETIREYALEQLEASGEAEPVRWRHARFFTTLAEAAEPHLHGAGKRAWIRRLEAEHDNLRAALAWAIAHAGATGLRLAGALVRFWHFHSHHREGHDWMLQALDEAPLHIGADGDRFRAKALNQAGYLAIWFDLTEASALLAQSVALWRTVGDQLGLAQALCDWGACMGQNTGDDRVQARALLEESIALFRSLDAKQNLIRACYWHGYITADLGDFVAARASAEESIRLGREVGDISNIAASTSTLANIAFHQGDYAAAQSLQEESLRLFREADDRPGIALAHALLGSLMHLQGRHDQARPLLEERLQIWRELDNPHGVARSLYTLGYVALRQNDRQQAAAHFAASLALFRDLGETAGMARCLAGLAEVATAAHLARAARLLAAMLALLESHNTRFEDAASMGFAGYPLTSQADIERQVATVRAALGDEAFEAAWVAGCTMTLEQAIAEALALSTEEQQ